MYRALNNIINILNLSGVGLDLDLNSYPSDIQPITGQCADCTILAPKLYRVETIRQINPLV
jgi:hypothetical protein